MRDLKRQCSDAEVLRVEVSPYTVQDQVSAPSHLFVISYSYLKLSECFQSIARVGKNEQTIVYKIQ